MSELCLGRIRQILRETSIKKMLFLRINHEISHHIVLCNWHFLKLVNSDLAPFVLHTRSNFFFGKRQKTKLVYVLLFPNSGACLSPLSQFISSLKKYFSTEIFLKIEGNVLKRSKISSRDCDPWVNCSSMIFLVALVGAVRSVLHARSYCHTLGDHGKK